MSIIFRQLLISSLHCLDSLLYEMHAYIGRIGCKVETRDFIYLYEFKRDAKAAVALRQIDSEVYMLPFVADSKRLKKGYLFIQQ